MSDSVSVDPMIGTEVAGCRVEAVLRRDDSGESLRCRVPTGGGRVVVRTVALASSGAGEARARIERICDELSKPVDDALVPIRECRPERGRLIVVRDWVDGRDLKASGGDDRTLSLTVTLDVASQAARGLDAARWAHGVVHGNLKPQNILLESSLEPDGLGRVWVVDFGFWPSTRETSELEWTGRARQLAYLAPELVGGEEPTASSDQYALACVLYECLTGQPPFGGSETSMVDAHLEEHPAPIRERRPEVPQAVDEAIRRALAKQPEHRFTSSSEFATALNVTPMAGVAEPALAASASRAAQTTSATGGGPSAEAGAHPSPSRQRARAIAVFGRAA